MKIIFNVTFVMILISGICFSQPVWYNQSSGTSSILQSIYFVDQDYGWIAGAHIILHTTDGGNTWIEQPAPPVSIFYLDIYFTDRMNGWACGNDAQIIHTSDGGNTWVIQPNSYTFPNPILYAIYFANPDTGWAIGGDHGNYPTFINRRVVLHTTNGGNTWDFQYSANGVKPLFDVHFINSSEAFTAAEWGDIMHTSNGGGTWSAKTPISSYELFGIYFTNSNNGWVAGEYLGLPHVSSISRTTDGGSTWDTQTFGTDEYLQDIYFVDDLTGWAVGGPIGGSGTATILHTTDGGINWVSQNSPVSGVLLGVWFVDENHGWAVGDNGTVIATENQVPVELTSFTANVNENDVTLNWQTATETNNSGFKIERKEPGERSREPGWENIGFIEGSGTTTEEHNYSFIDKNLKPGSYLYKLVQIDFDGTRNESEAVNIEVISLPRDYSLSQNYPNPFNPTTTIQFSIPESGNVKISLFNSLGELKEILAADYKQAGSYEVNFDAKNFASGIYYYKLDAGDFTTTRKMILLK